MALRHLQITAFRCLSDVSLDLDPGRNYVFGANAAGKTSLLEATCFLSRGRSFRTRRSRSLIQEGHNRLTVHGRVSVNGQQESLGVALDQDGLTVRMSGSPARTVELAQRFPVLVIDPTVHQLIEGGPDARRRFLDWGVFHVEHGYLGAWRRYRRALSQRNAQLKSSENADLKIWDRELLEAGGQLTDQRQAYVQRLNDALAGISTALLATQIRCKYRPGWPRDLDFSAALKRAETRDRERGLTNHGPHRAELKVLLDESAVRERASRGQQKLVAAALTLAQVEVFNGLTGGRPMLLVDDPAAELSWQFLEGFLEELWKSPAQLLITGLSRGVMPDDPGYPVFHVEQGNLSKVL